MKIVNTKITNNKGFSLLEVLVGVSIIGIISAIAVPTFTSYREGASVTASSSTLTNVKKAFNLCMSMSGQISSCNTLEALDIECGDCSVNTDTGNTKFCGAVSTGVGGKTFQACWDNTDDSIVYGGDFKICYGQYDNDTTDSTAAVRTAFPNLKKCKTNTDCSGSLPTAGANQSWGGGTCEAGGHSIGVCTAGACQS